MPDQIQIKDPNALYTTGWAVREKYPAQAVRMYPYAVVECALCGQWWISKRDGVHTSQAHEDYTAHNCTALRSA